MTSSDLEYNDSGVMSQETNYDDASTYIGPFTAIFTTVLQLFSSLSIAVPALFIIAIIIQQPRLNNFRYWFIGNLLFCNILVGIVFLPAAIDAAVHMFTDQEFSMQFIVGFALVPFVAYCLMCCIIFTDMFCYLFFDKYQDFLTPKKATMVVKIVWFSSCVYVVLLNVLQSSNPYSSHIILLITVIVVFVIKGIIGVAVLCLNALLFYYWTKVNIKLQAEVLNLPTTQNRCRLHKQIEVFVRVESCMKQFFAFFLMILFSIAVEIIEVIITYYNLGFYNAPVSFVIFIVLTWVECIFCVIAYSILLMIIFHHYCFKNKVMPT